MRYRPISATASIRPARIVPQQRGLGSPSWARTTKTNMSEETTDDSEPETPRSQESDGAGSAIQRQSRRLEDAVDRAVGDLELERALSRSQVDSGDHERGDVASAGTEAAMAARVLKKRVQGV
jgi:hypothetical protein